MSLAEKTLVMYLIGLVFTISAVYLLMQKDPQWTKQLWYLSLLAGALWFILFPIWIVQAILKRKRSKG